MPILNMPLGLDGPIVELSVSVSEPWRQALLSAGQPLSNEFQALLGRDLLDSCLFFYNGPQQTFSLAF